MWTAAAFVAAPADNCRAPVDACGAIARIALMRHRGPDESGTWHAVDGASERRVQFSKPSIIDIAHSRQPLR